MKTIGIVTDGNTNLGIFLEHNLKMVLGNHVKITNHYLKNLFPEDILHDDLIMVMMESKTQEIAPRVKNLQNIIVVERTILLSSYHELLNLPAGIDVLVVNDNDITSLETVNLLKELGIRHIHLIPYKKGKHYPKVHFAITPGERSCVPNSIKEIIDIDHRYIDLSTFFAIITKLALNHDEINQNLKNYLERIVSPYSVMKDKVQESFVKKNELETLMELSNDGILLTDKAGNIRVGNKKIAEFLETDLLKHSNVRSLFPTDWASDLLANESLENHILSYKSKIFNLNKKALCYFDTTYGYYYAFQELTYIKQLEQCLSKKLRSMGHHAKYRFDDIVCESPLMRQTIQMCKKIAKTDLTVMLIGESGTGKELIAQSIHNASPRKNAPFIAINSAAMPEHLLESELFGYEEGAFTGALKGGKKGLILQANHGTVFLDEIGDMPIHLQTKLLRVLQERQIMAVGSGNIIDIDVRFIVATNKDLEHLSSMNQFRADLYYRINTFQINLPPLRERKEDILAIAHHVLGTAYELDKDAKQALCNYPYKGNIRELFNILNYSKTLCESTVIGVQDLPPYLSKKTASCNPVSMSIDPKIWILTLLKNQGAMGRQKILSESLALGYAFSEAEIKQWLNLLKKEGYIASGVGRTGSFITKKGLEALDW